MPSDNRDTNRRNFSLKPEATQAIDSFAEEHNITKSKVVERAVLEYTGRDRTARLENKINQILEIVDEWDDSSIQTIKKQKTSQNTPEFTPTNYDPFEDRNQKLTKSELNQLIKIDEPVINPQHIDDENFPGRENKKAAIISALIRYDTMDSDMKFFMHPKIESYIKQYLGDSDYILNTYTKKIADNFKKHYTMEYIAKNAQDEKYIGYFITQDMRQEYYKERFEEIKKAVNTPVTEIPKFDINEQVSYEYIQLWLNNKFIESSIKDLNIATSEEINKIKNKLDTYQDKIDKCVDIINDSKDRKFEKLNREEAIEAISHEKQPEKMVMLLDELNYILKENERDG